MYGKTLFERFLVLTWKCVVWIWYCMASLGAPKQKRTRKWTFQDQTKKSWKSELIILKNKKVRSMNRLNVQGKKSFFFPWGVNRGQQGFKRFRRCYRFYQDFFGKYIRFETVQISFFVYSLQLAPQTESKSFHAKNQTIGVTEWSQVIMRGPVTSILKWVWL